MDVGGIDRCGGGVEELLGHGWIVANGPGGRSVVADLVCHSDGLP
jgi:hypothetical protein